VGALITLLFEYINQLFPDALGYLQGASLSSVRTTMSMLIVVFPAFLGISWFLRKDLVRHPEKKEFALRKFLYNMTLFIAALVIVIDLITLLNNFLEGELTTRFVLKVLAVFFVAGGVFAYYLWELRRPVDSKPSKILLWGAASLILATVLSGFVIIGSPSEQRMRRFDERRVSDLSTLQYQIIAYWSSKNDLPVGLEELNSAVTGYTPPVDPETGSSYEYSVKGENSFELCATFALASDPNDPSAPDYYYGYYGSKVENWDHEAGRHCFSRTLDPQLDKLPGDAPSVLPVRY